METPLLLLGYLFKDVTLDLEKNQFQTISSIEATLLVSYLKQREVDPNKLIPILKYTDLIVDSLNLDINKMLEVLVSHVPNMEEKIPLLKMMWENMSPEHVIKLLGILGELIGELVKFIHVARKPQVIENKLYYSLKFHTEVNIKKLSHQFKIELV